MNCSQVRESFKDYLEEKLSPGQVAALNRHLQQCPDCRQELAFLKLYQSRLQTMAHPQPPADLLARVQRGIITAEAKKSGRRFRPVLLLAPGMAALVLLLVIMLVPWQFGGISQRVVILPGEDLAAEKEQPLSPQPAPVASKTAAPTKSEQLGRISPVLQELASLPELALNLMVAPAAPTLKTAADTAAAPDKQKRTNQTGTGVTESQPGLSKGTTPPDAAPTELVQKLRELIASLGGTISAEKFDPQQQQLEQLTFKIPATNYQKLLTGLAGLGQLQPTAPAPLLQEGQIIRLSLQYQP